MVTFILLVVGGLNWLLVGFDFNLVDYIFGVGSMVSQVVYILVGLSAVYQIATHKSSCRACSSAPQM